MKCGLGPEPEQMLETPTYEAFAIRALYTALDELPEPPLPGEWPFLRGGDALRDVKSGWKVAEAFRPPGAGSRPKTSTRRCWPRWRRGQRAAGAGRGVRCRAGSTGGVARRAST